LTSLRAARPWAGYLVLALVAGGAWAAAHVVLWRRPEAGLAGRLFKLSGVYLLILFGALAADVVLRG